MILGRISSSMPDDAGFLTGFSFMLVLFRFALAAHGIHSCPMHRLFLGKNRASNICPPLLTPSAAPVSESAGWDSVKVEHIPPRVIASLTVARESIQLPIGLNDLGWM